jgi:hypothetical protein
MLLRSLICLFALLATGTALGTRAAAAAADKSAPEIFSLSPNEGPAGAKIKVRGNGFKGTRYVLFCAGRTGRTAKFKVISDSELEVTAPPYLRAGLSAMLAVVTSSGATIAMPASALEVGPAGEKANTAASFYHVLNGGALQAPQGVVLVEEGGVAAAPKTAAICLIKRGGSLQNAEHFSGVVIHEPKAHIELGGSSKQRVAKPQASLRLLMVPEIAASLGVEPFVYYRSESAETLADSPPLVRSFSPARVPSGGIVTLHGTGFSQTDEVLLVSHRLSAADRVAAFRVISDKELEVEVPDTLTGSADLVIVNPKGATLVTSRHDVKAQTPQQSGRPKSSRTTGRKPSVRTVSLVNNTFVESVQTGQVSFVREGGLANEAASGAVVLVRNGGRVSLPSNGGIVFHEPQATISGANRNKSTIREVPSVNLNVLSSTFEAYKP